MFFFFFFFFFFFNDTATTEIYTVSDTLSLHDALPICGAGGAWAWPSCPATSTTPSQTQWRRSDRKSTRLNSSHLTQYRMPSSACKKKRAGGCTVRSLREIPACSSPAARQSKRRHPTSLRLTASFPYPLREAYDI